MADRKRRLCFAVWLLIGAVEASSTQAVDESPAEVRLRGLTTAVADASSGSVFADQSQLNRVLLIRSVLESNPSLRAARSALEASRARPAQAGSLSDPTLSYTFAPQSVFSNDVRYGQVLRFSQRLPYPGKRRLRREIAELESEGVAWEVDAMRLELATAASRLFDDYYVVERAIEINGEHIELLETFKRVATARYAAGEAPQQAPLQAEMEVAHMIHRRVLLETERSLITTRLNRLLHRSPVAYLPPPPRRLDVSEPAAEGSREMRIGEALGQRPEVKAARSDLEARRLEIELVSVESKPDFEVMGSYNSMWSRSDHRLMVGAGVSLPLYRGRWRAAAAETEATVMAIESELEELLDLVRAQVTEADLLLREAEHVLALYSSRLLPAAADQITASLAGFSTGQSTFLSLIEAERNQRGVQLEYEKAVARVHRRQAELDRAMGRLPGGVSHGDGGARSENSEVGGSRR